MAYKTKKPKQKLTKAEELTLAKSQFNAYTRARDNGHEEYIEMAKKFTSKFNKGGGSDMRKTIRSKPEFGGISKTLLPRKSKKRMTAKEFVKAGRNLNAARLTKTEGSFSGGGMARGGGAAIRGKNFQGIF